MKGDLDTIRHNKMPHAGMNKRQLLDRETEGKSVELFML